MKKVIALLVSVCLLALFLLTGCEHALGQGSSSDLTDTEMPISSSNEGGTQVGDKDPQKESSRSPKKPAANNQSGREPNSNESSQPDYSYEDDDDDYLYDFDLPNYYYDDENSSYSEDKAPDQTPVSPTKPEENTSSQGENKFIYDENGFEYVIEDGKLWLSNIGGCTDKNITIPSKVNGTSVYGIYSSALTNNENIETLTISEGITTVGATAFLRCKNLKSVNFPSTLKSVDDYSFAGCAISEIKLPKGLTTIGKSAFSCNTFTKLVLPDSVKTVEDGAFSGTHIEKISIPAGVTFGKSVFRSCLKLKTVVIEDGVKGISSQMFQKCSALTSVHFPASFKHFGSKVFDDCSSLVFDNIDVRGTVGNYAFSGVLLKNVNIYSNVSNYAFEGIVINNLIIHEGVTTIGENSFMYSVIDKITLPTSLTTVKSDAFYGARVSDVCFKGPVSLGFGAFKNSDVQTVTLPAGSVLDRYIFKGCSKLKTIYYGGTKQEWNNMVKIPTYGFNESDFKEIRSATIVCSDATI